MHSRSLIVLRLILVALLPTLQFFSAHASSDAVVQAAAAQASGTWRLDKVTVKDSGLANQPTWTVSHSDGSLSSSIPYVIHTAMGDTTGTWDGTNTWDSPPLLLHPGVTNTTTVSATDSCTAVNGATSSHHETTLFVDGTPIGRATARSQSNQGQVSDSKTLTWKMPAGSYPGQRLGVTVTADLGATQVVYTYEYVWESTDVGQLVNPPQPTATTALSRQITVVGYDASDTIHTPLTYLIRATQNGEALADETILFQFFGDLDCLADQYGVWNSAGGQWTMQSADLHARASQATKTDSRGYVAIRGFLDFNSMKKSGKQLPCSETLRAAVSRYKNDASDLIKADATVNVKYPVFITGVFFRAAKDPHPQFFVSPWIPLGMLANQYQEFVTDRYEGDPAKPAYPGWTSLLERLTVEGKHFNPPALDRSYYFPVNAGGDLNIRMCNDPVNDHAFMAFGDGLAVTVLWMDGAQGGFTQVRKDNDEPCGLQVKFSPDVYSDFETNNPENWVRFAIGQVGDWFVEKGVGIVGTALAGPGVGIAAQSLVEMYNLQGDIGEIGSIHHDYRTLVVRSAVSVTTAADGLRTLYNFEGNPAVVDDTGKEIVAAPGEAIDFRLTGPVSAPARRDPPAEAVALKVLTAHDPGPTAAANFPAAADIPEPASKASASPAITPTPAPSASAVAATPAPSRPPQSAYASMPWKTFKDDFSSPSTGWPQVSDTNHMLGYSEGSMYGIAIKTDNMDSGVLIPHAFGLPINESELHFTIRPVEGTGYFGVLCDYVDKSDLIAVSVTDGTYAIGRFFNGQYTSLLSSFWAQDAHIVAENGEFQVWLQCGDTIQLMVNGYSLPTVNNPNRTKGNIALFVHSHKGLGPDPVFNYQVLIDDVELKAR